MNFRSTILTLPGLGNSGDQHWQTIWEKRFPNFVRVQQDNWDTPVRQDWVLKLDQTVMKYDPSNVILVGHSLACCTIAYWAQEYKRVIRGALLVAPSDTESANYPTGTTGFSPMPMAKLPFRSLTVLSTNDPFVKIDRGLAFANAWGSESVTIGNAGHINAESRLMFWEFGLELLSRLDGD